MAVDPSPSPAEQVKLAAEAYIYGYPLVYGLEEMKKYPAGEATLVNKVRVPYNHLGANRELATPEVEFVSPNNDTVYQLGVVDVGRGPVVLHVPDTKGRYYVFVGIDAWTNNFCYIGRRATGTDEAHFLFTPRGWKGDVPAGIKAVVEAPTRVFVSGSRYAVNGQDDLPEVHALQDATTWTPLNVWLGGEDPGAVHGIPEPTPGVRDDLLWWERFRVALNAFPPPEADSAFVELAARFGVTAADSPYVDPDPQLAQVLVEGAKAGQAEIEALMKRIHASPEGWQSARHLFDFNIDFLGLGTIDAPEWKIADRTKAYATRAVVARGGLWGNHGYEADYELIWVDRDGEQLDGSHRYELRLPAPPPVDAFWSLTMYDVPEFYLVANPIDRYSIGDRTPGLKYGDDGSVTIYMQKDSPAPDKASNWLPTPAGAFRPVLRLYTPRKEILDGSYQLPAIKRVG